MNKMTLMEDDSPTPHDTMHAKRAIIKTVIALSSSPECDYRKYVNLVSRINALRIV